MADIVEIDVALEEKNAGALTAQHLEAATQALREDGCVVLTGVVDPAHLALLCEKMREDAAAILALPDVPTQFTSGNIQQDPPPFAPYLFQDIVNNPLVVQVTQSILGPGLKNGFYSGNTNLPGSQAQPVHPDDGQLWPGLAHSHPAYSLVVNVPVVDMDARNGSTELWPGTHRDLTMFVQQGTIRVPAEQVEARRAVRPPLQPSVKAGSVMIRDMRLWHRGMPNHADALRPMIAMIHSVSWWPTPRLVFEKGSESLFAGTALQTPADFVDGPIDYLRRHTAYDVQKDAQK